MKTILSVVAFAAVLTAAPGACFALWEVMTVSSKEAKELGLLVRTKAAGPDHVSVELDFRTEGQFKAFIPGNRFNDGALVQLWIGQGDNSHVTAALKEDRSQAGRVVVSFTADRVQLDQSSLRVFAPYTDGGTGGAQYQLRVKDFVEPKKDR